MDTLKYKKLSLENLIPTSVYRSLAFKKICKSIKENNGVIYKLANSYDERKQAINLIDYMYKERGIIPKNQPMPELTAFNLSSSSTVFIAKKGDEVVGTLSLIEDSYIGLPMESIHQQEILSIRQAERRVAEVGALAVKKGFGVSLMLYNIMFRWAKRSRYIDNLAISVHPSSLRFFRDVLLFSQLGKIKNHPKYNNALAVALTLDVPNAIQKFKEIYNRSGFMINSSTNLYEFFCEKKFDNVFIPESSPFEPEFQKIPQWSKEDTELALSEFQINFENMSKIKDFYFESFKSLNRNG